MFLCRIKRRGSRANLNLQQTLIEKAYTPHDNIHKGKNDNESSLYNRRHIKTTTLPFHISSLLYPSLPSRLVSFLFLPFAKKSASLYTPFLLFFLCFLAPLSSPSPSSLFTPNYSTSSLPPLPFLLSSPSPILNLFP